MAFTGEKVTATNTLSDVQDAAGTTTSTSFTATLTGGTACGLAFVAPASGAVVIHNNCDVNNDGAGFSAATIEVRAGGTIGSGTVVLAAGFHNHVLTTDIQISGCRTAHLTGLTPGSTYNVRQLYSVGSGTGTFAFKNLIVEGCI